jgi:hypothetical protein
LEALRKVDRLIDVKVPGNMKNPASINQHAAAAATLYLRPISFDSRTYPHYPNASNI